MLSDFKKFIRRGNVVDMAIGIVIGTAFAAVSRSLVDDVIMPPLGLATGNLDFENMFVVLREGTRAAPYATLAEAKAAGAVVISYGVFVTALVNFFIVGLAMFFLLRTAERATEKFRREEPSAAGPRKCPYCVSPIADTAIRCPHCTSHLEDHDAPPSSG